MPWNLLNGSETRTQSYEEIVHFQITLFSFFLLFIIAKGLILDGYKSGPLPDIFAQNFKCNR